MLIIGTIKIIQLLKINRNLSKIIAIFITTLSLAIYWRLYFIDYPKYSSSRAWNSDLVEAIKYADPSSYDCIFLSYQKYIPAYILILFYTQDPPQNLNKFLFESDDLKFRHIDRYHIINLDDLEIKDKSCLFIANSKEVKLRAEKNYKVTPLHIIYEYKTNQSYHLIEIS